MRLRVLLATTLAATAFSAQPASAAPFSFSFDWAGSPATGFFGWQRTDQLPAPGADPPFLPPYDASVRSGAGPGIRLAPSPAADGTRDRIYSNYDASTQSGGPKINETYTAPGTTTIARARIRDVSFLNDSEGQILRAAIIDQTGAFAAESAYGMDDGSPPPGPFLPGVTYSNVILPELSWPGYATGIASRLELSLRTICVPAGNCPVVHFQPDGTPMSSGRFGTVELDLIDPEAPSLNLGGSLTTSSGWVNTNRSGRLTFTAQDPGSGVRKLRLERRGSSGTTVVLNETIACDLSHSSPPPGTLPGGACPAQADRSVAQSVSTNGVTTFLATATDLSGQSTTGQTQVRIDRQRPTATLAGPLRALAGRWTNRSDAVTAVVAGADALSGISKLRVAESAATSSAAEAAVCTTGGGPRLRCAPAATAHLAVALGGLHDGRRTLRAFATDLAGNRSATVPGVTLLLDRTSPGVPRNVKLVRVGGGARATFSRPGADGGSPIRAVETRTAAASGSLGAWRATSASSSTVQGRSTESIHVEVRSVDVAGNRSRTIRVDLPARVRSATGRPTCRPGRRCARAPQRAPTPRGRVAQKIQAAAEARRAACPVPIDVPPDQDVQQQAKLFQAQNTRIGIRLRFGYPIPGFCRDVVTKIVTMTGLVRVRRSGLRTPQIDNEPVAYVLASRRVSLYFDCTPALDGTQVYVVSFPGGFETTVRGPKDRFPVPAVPQSINQKLRIPLTCPTTEERQRRELNAWDDLIGYNPQTGNTTSISNLPDPRTRKRRKDFARDVLRAALAGEFPSGPRAAWEAHHIIPLADIPRRGRVVVTAAFHCRLYPNVARNGVYLRDRLANRGSALFEQIPEPADRLRTWHPFTQAPYLDDYFGRLRGALVRSGAIDDGKGTCRSRSTFDRVLTGAGNPDSIKNELATGRFFPPGRPER